MQVIYKYRGMFEMQSPGNMTDFEKTGLNRTYAIPKADKIMCPVE